MVFCRTVPRQLISSTHKCHCPEELTVVITLLDNVGGALLFVSALVIRDPNMTGTCLLCRSSTSYQNKTDDRGEEEVKLPKTVKK